MKRSARRLLIWTAIICFLIVLWELVKAGGPRVREISYSEFLSQVEAGGVRRVTIVGSEARGVYRDGKSFVVMLPAREDPLAGLLRRQNVEVWYEDVQAKWPVWLLNLAPLAVFGFLLYLMLKQIREIRVLVEGRPADRAERSTQKAE